MYFLLLIALIAVPLILLSVVIEFVIIKILLCFVSVETLHKAPLVVLIVIFSGILAAIILGKISSRIYRGHRLKQIKESKSYETQNYR